MVEGELPEEGLAALEGDGGDVYLALARRLADAGEGGDGRAHSLEALFAEARRREDEADELLVGDDWEAAAAAPLEPILVPVQAAPGEPPPLTDLPLLATGPTALVPPSAPPNGKVVTLEELAQVLRHRKPRTKPVPEGQPALFDT
jgi:hypothetical protein